MQVYNPGEKSTMFTSYRFQNFAIAILASIVLLVSTPALASATETGPDGVPQSIFNLDLCTLAYQFYHQSLCVSLDPWYDIMSRIGSDRRNNICKFTHVYATSLGNTHGFYSGPNAARGWNNSNLNLDPILTNYKHIDAKIPTFNCDGGRFIVVRAPDYVTRNIKVIEGVRYKTKPTAFPFNGVELFPIRQYPGGEDHLVVFEGGTGVAGTSQPSWSPMGFVLMKKTATGYDAHIVFRGSRSGSSLSKTVWKAQDKIGDAKGNADWITDLRGSNQITKPLVSKVGTVTEGFAESLPTMLGPIAASCKYLGSKYGSPNNIYVTGHSLGAGLGSQFVSAAIQGSYGDVLEKEVAGWPWKSTKLIAFAQPIPGDPTWADNFNKISPVAQHYWVSGDAVVEATSNRIVGMLIDKGKHCGIQNKLSSVANCNDNPHEVFVIRAAMVRDLAASNPTISNQLGQQNTWGYYETFAKMLAGQPLSYVYPGAPPATIVTQANLKQILKTSNFGSEFAHWLENVYAKMIADKSSYIGIKFQSTLDKRQKLVLDIVQRMKQPSTNNNAQELNNLVKEFSLIDDNLGLTNEEQWIYCGAILARLEKSSLTLNELLSQPVIKKCLEAKFDD